MLWIPCLPRRTRPPPATPTLRRSRCRIPDSPPCLRDTTRRRAPHLGFLLSMVEQGTPGSVKLGSLLQPRDPAPPSVDASRGAHPHGIPPPFPGLRQSPSHGVPAGCSSLPVGWIVGAVPKSLVFSLLLAHITGGSPEHPLAALSFPNMQFTGDGLQFILVAVDAIPTAVQCAHDGFVCMCVFCVVAGRRPMFLYNAKIA